MANSDGITIVAPKRTILDDIVDREKEFVRLFNLHDAPRLVDLYTEDAQVLPPNAQPVEGRDALEALFRGFWSEGFTVIDLTTKEVEGSGEMMFEVGTYKLNGQRKGDATDEGKYIVVWKKRVNGEWRLHRDMFNTSRPAPEDKNQIERS